MALENRITFAVVGAGRIGKRHADLIDQREDAELVAACDIKSAEKLGWSKEQPLYTELADMLAKHSPDVVCICSPNGLHAQHAVECIQAGSHVVIEKPMGLSSEACEAVMHASFQYGKSVFCVMQNRYSPPSAWLKEILDKKLLGEIYQVNVQCFWNREDDYYSQSDWKGSEDLDGGVIFTQFSHFIDMMYWLLGDIKNIAGRMNLARPKTHSKLEDNGAFTFDFVNGGLGSLQFSSSVYQQNYASSITIVAENGTVKVGGQYMNELEYCDIKDYETPVLPEGNPANNYGTYKGSAANHIYIFDNVVDSLQGRSPITTNALEGLKVVSIIERLYKAAGIATPATLQRIKA